jgi:hypothetical protein
MTRQSIHLLRPFAKKMDARVKPGHDEPKTTGTDITAVLALVDTLRARSLELAARAVAISCLKFC